MVKIVILSFSPDEKKFSYLSEAMEIFNVFAMDFSKSQKATSPNWILKLTQLRFLSIAGAQMA